MQFVVHPDEQGRIYFETIIVYLYNVLNTDLEKVMENMYQISQEVSEYADSIAMKLIRKGREEAETKAKKRIAEERQKAIEAKKKEKEAKKKQLELQQKAEAEKKAAIYKMLQSGVKKELIADFLSLAMEKLDAYISEIEKEKKI